MRHTVIENIITKGLVEHSQRILSLESSNFKKCENSDIIGYDSYYIL